MRSKSTEDKVEKNIILKYYDIDKRIGKGAYGVVYKAHKKANNQPVALKKIYDAFRTREDAQRTYREVIYLKSFRGHPNIIQLLNIHKSNNNRDLYLVFEFMELDLQRYLVEGQKLRESQIRFIIYQVLKALKYIHSGSVVHRDVKPSNILLNWNFNCKLADFGLARSLHDNMRPDPGGGSLTDYVATRWYRAPEILMGAKRYSKVVDIWSLGCVLAEMVTGQPLFPGSSSLNQLELIGRTLKACKHCLDGAMAYMGCEIRIILPPGPKYPLKDRLAGASSECVDLASRLLELDPFRRPSASEAIRHPYVYGHRSQEPVMNHPILPKYSDSIQLSIQDYRSALYNYDKNNGYRQFFPPPSTLQRRNTKAPKPSTDPEVNSRKLQPVNARKSISQMSMQFIRGRGYTPANPR